MKLIPTCLGISLLAVSCASHDTKTASTAAIVSATKAKAYPLTVCLVTGDDLDEMDERVSTVHNGQTFEFCCKPCIVKFNKDPEKYVSKLEIAKNAR